MMLRSTGFLSRIAAILVMAGLGWAAAPPRPAYAHASLTGSDPESGAALAHPPETVTLEFSETLDGSLSKAKLVDMNNQVVAGGPGYIDPEDPLALKLDLPPLPEGAYSVVWQARSAVDGHITQGSVAFSIGQAAAQASLVPPPSEAYISAASPPVAETLLRWLSYLAAALMAGSLLFGMLVWRPAYRRWETPDGAVDELAARRLRWLAGFGAAGLLLLSILTVFYQAWEASQGPFEGSFGSALLQLLGLQNGLLLWARFLLLVLIMLLARRLPGPGAGPRRPWWGAILLAGAVLLTFSLQAHGAALGSPWAVALDWLHLAAMSAWIGGLLPLLLFLRLAALPSHLLAPRFSLVGLASVGALALSGLGSALLHVRTLEALLSTFYGRALLLKLALFGLLIGLGAINLLILSPRLKDRLDRSASGLKLSVRLELLLGACILLLSGLLTGAFPALAALQAERRAGFIGSYAEDPVRLRLWVAPGRAGDNEVAVDVEGISPAESPHLQVLLRFTPPGLGTGTTQVETQQKEGSRYSARGSYLSMAGSWQVEVILRRHGLNDVRHTFDLQVQGGEGESTLPNPIPPNTASLAAGEALYRENCLPCHGPEGRGDGPAGLALNPRPVDLTIHTVPGVHTDGQLFEWITNGYPGSAMPAFRDLLTEEQRWRLVNYIRTLSPPQD
jgi:copper transport protein